MMLIKKIEDGGEVKERIHSWIMVLYNLILFKQGNASIEDGNKKVFESLEKSSDFVQIVSTVRSLFLLLAKLETNASKRLLLEDFILQNE